MDIDELAAQVDHASLRAGAICTKQTIEAGEPIGMDHAVVSLEAG